MQIGRLLSRGVYTPEDTNVPYPHADVGVGIEIELEGARGQPSDLVTRWWRHVGDGSLRDHGIEFVSQILHGTEIHDALRAVNPYMQTCTASWRCGIHVHADVRSYDINQLSSILSLYCLLEPLLFAWEGNKRDVNNFCVPWYVSPVHLDTFATQLGTVTSPGSREAVAALSALSNLPKYTALNLNPIPRQGSIEFRFMQTTKDVTKIAAFVRMCQTVVGEGAQLGEDTPLMLLSAEGGDTLLRRLGLMELTAVENYRELLWRGVSTANFLPILKSPITVDTLVDEFNEDFVILGD